MDEDVVTETSLPDRSGWKEDRRGSTLCRIVCTWKLCQPIVIDLGYGAAYLRFFGYDTWCPF